jgi:hypothetical protein
MNRAIRSEWKFEVGSVLFLALLLLGLGTYSVFEVATTGVLTLGGRGMSTSAEGPLAWVLSLLLLFLGLWPGRHSYRLWRAGPQKPS